MTLSLETTSSLSPVNHCLVYGRAKTGKTRLIATAPNPVICSTDEGLVSIREYNIPYKKIVRYADYLAFEQAAASGQLDQFDTVAIDDLTELAEIFLVEEKPKHKNLLQAYGALNDEIMRVVRFWRHREKFTTVLICKQDRIKDESTGGLIYAPLIPGKAIAPMLPYLFGSIFHMETWTDPQSGQVHEVLRCKSNSQYDAGDRSGKLGELELANLTQIFNKVLS